MNDNKNVFLVEDDKDDQEFFISALNKIENAVLYDIANNGREALRKLETATILPSLIFMDINMPKMNGIECLAVIVNKPEINDIPVVILSTDTKHVEVVRKLGAKAFIKKPSNTTSLRQKLEQVINLDFNSESYITNQSFHASL